MIREEYFGTGNISTHNAWNEAVGSGKSETTIAAGKAVLLSIDAQNNGAAAAYLRLYDKATDPVVGTDTPVFTYMIPADGGKTSEKNLATEFGTGLAYAITSDPGALGSTGVTNADEVVVNLEYFDKF